MHLHKYLVLLHEVLLPSIPDVRSIAAGHQLTRTHALKHCEKTMKAIFHECLHKKKRCSLPCISHEQRTSCSHRHPYKPLQPGPGAKYQFDFFSKLSLTFSGHSPLQACSYLRTILDFLVNYTLACRIYTLLFNQRCGILLGAL